MGKKDPIKELAKAGKSSEVCAVVARLGEQAHLQYEQIRKDRTITEAHREKLLAAAYVRTRRELDQELEEMARYVTVADSKDASSVFGVEGLRGDAASLTISRRDAGDRVAAITDQAELAAILKRATRTGDEVLARAVGERACQIQSVDVMQEFLDARPALDKAGERLWNAQKAESGWDFSLTLQLGDLRAPELSRLDSGAIQRLAEDEITDKPQPRSVFDSSSATPAPPDMTPTAVYTGAQGW